LHRYAGVDGIKTGYTRASGFNLVSSVRRDGKHVVAAVFGGKTAASRNAKMQQILNRTLAKASPKVTRKPALVARAPHPQPARPPRQVAEAPRAAAPPQTQPSPAARERSNAITVAKVLAVRIDDSAPAPRAAPRDAQPAFAVA